MLVEGDGSENEMTIDDGAEGGNYGSEFEESVATL